VSAMKPNKSATIAIALAIGGALTAGFVGGRLTTTPLQPLPGEVLVSEGQPVNINVTRPTVLSVVMEDDDAAEQRCLDMGGWPDGQICRNVDY